MPPTSAVVRGCCQTSVAQTDTPGRFQRQRQLRPGSSCGHRFPLFCKPSTFLLAGSGERAAVTLTRVAGYRRSPQGKTTTPNYSLKHARSGSDTSTASTYPFFIRPRRSRPSRSYLWVIFMRFCGPQALRDTNVYQGLSTFKLLSVRLYSLDEVHSRCPLFAAASLVLARPAGPCQESSQEG